MQEWTKQYTVKNVLPGIYYVEGDTSPTQILVSAELPEDENVWLTNLRKNLTAEQLDRVITAGKARASIGAYFYTIVEANTKTAEELYMRKKNDIFLTEKLDAIFRERNSAALIAEGKAEGIAEGVAIGEAKGEAKVGREIILESLRERFGRVPKNVERAINQMNDPIALKSLAVRTANCKTLDEFVAEL